MFIQAFDYGLKLFGARSLQERVACGVVILAWTYMGAFLRIQRNRLRVPPEEDVAREWIVYYRSEMERICSASIFVQFFVPLTILFAGMIFVDKGGTRENAIFSTLLWSTFAGVKLFCAWKRRQFQRQIEVLDAVLNEAR
jgi:hypothetical protein